MEFCSAFLGCKITTDKPCRDGFPVTNLISDPKCEFIGESFIRPPCRITIDFPVPVDIAFIKLQTQVNERKITSFKIFMKDSLDDEEHCLGNWFSVTKNKVLLKNYNYRHWIPFELPKDQGNSIEDTLVCALKNINSKKFANGVQSLRIVITSVTPTGPPVLKSIHIWGQPSLKCSVSRKNNILKLWSEKLNSNVTNMLTISSGNITKIDEEKKGEKRKLSDETDIPEDFLDPLTFEVMKLPILLPSGNSIDSFSLEKFLSNEAGWGRSPSDPFTGLPFKNGYKPEANVHLKARIDRFFLIERHLDTSCLKSLGYTLMDTYTERKSESSSNEIKASVPKSTPMVPVNKKSKDSQRRSIPNRITHDTLPRFEVKTKDNFVTSTSRHNFVQSIGTALSSVRKSRSCVQPKVSSTLNETPVLSTLTTRTSTISPVSTISEVDKYSLAGLASASLRCSCGNQTGLFYALKCKHRLCDDCIKGQFNKKNTIECGECGDTSLSQHVIRIHPKSAFAT